MTASQAHSLSEQLHNMFFKKSCSSGLNRFVTVPSNVEKKKKKYDETIFFCLANDTFLYYNDFDAARRFVCVVQ